MPGRSNWGGRLATVCMALVWVGVVIPGVASTYKAMWVAGLWPSPVVGVAAGFVGAAAIVAPWLFGPICSVRRPRGAEPHAPDKEAPPGVWVCALIMAPMLYGALLLLWRSLAEWGVR